ncbi:MAG TPA: tetratricopeptide repeat protein, partial [Candidatus Kapabacteria bacterium]|nr:tetratricopeptide repeat protein [Candidatus Kapabacteria bacterium]
MRSDLSEFRVFLSSTFHDLREERDHLTKKVFPEIRRKCRERGIEFTEVDLRWGVTDEEARAGLVLRTCLEEIDRCRPFFLGIVGDRYGWRPTRSDVAGDKELFKDYPILERLIDNEASATAIEMHYGVFQAPKNVDLNAVFFIRENTRPSAPADVPKLADLRSEIQYAAKEDPDHVTVHHFAHAATLGELVRDELLRLLDLYWPASEGDVWLDREAQEQEAFAVSRRRGYLPDPDSVKWLEECLKDPEERVVFVSAPPGAGKSSLMAHWAACQRLKGKQVHVLEHYVGATSGGGDHLSILQRIYGEIARHSRSADTIPTDPQQLVEQLPFWLAKVVDYELVIFIDALDQLTGVAAELEWLPRYLPQGVRLIVSAAADQPIAILRSRGWPEYQLQPLSLEYRQLIVRQYLGSFSKKLSQQQQDRITRHEKCANPLFLRTVLEELRVLGVYERLDEEIDKYLASEDLLGLFSLMLERIERDFGDPVVAVMSFLVIAPSGLTESELIDLSRVSRAELSALVNALDYHLIRHSGALAFFHPLLNRAAEQRYVTADLRQEGQIELLRVFDRERIDVRSLRIRLALLKELEMWRELIATLSDLRIFTELNEPQTKYELYESWQLGLKHSPEKKKIADHYSTSIHHTQRDEHSSSTLLDGAKLYLSLAEFIRDCGDYEGADAFAQRALERSNDKESIHLDCLRVAANIKLHLSKPAEAEPIIEEASRISKRVYGESHSSTLKIENERVWLLQLQGKPSDAAMLARELATRYESTFGALSPETAHSRSHLGALLRETGQLEEAYAIFKSVLASLKKIFGSRYPDTAGAINDLAVTAQDLGRYDEADELLEESASVLQSLLGAHHPHVAQAVANRALLVSRKGQIAKAEQLFQVAIELQAAAYGAESANLAPTLNNYGMLLARTGKYAQAEQYLLRSSNIFRSVYGNRHPLVASSQNGLGRMMIDAGNFEKAERYLNEAFSIRSEVLGTLHPATLKTRHNLGVLHRQSGELIDAENLLSEVRAAREIALGKDHVDTAETSHELGELYLEEGRLNEALPLLRSAYAVRSK